MSRVLPLLCSILLTISAFAQKNCADSGYFDHLLSVTPELRQKQASVEQFIQNAISRRTTALSATALLSPGTTTTNSVSSSLPEIITIPVVVHILYNTDAQNISDAQVHSQIEALNNDFRKKNSDRSQIPSYFADLAADCGIEFKLAATDPRGYSTTGIIRRKTNIQNFGIDDRAKYSSQGGDDAWNASYYLNIWVCNLTGGVIGYSSTVGCAPQVDGVVIYTGAFGVDPSNGSNFNMGRTATHEIGHWLNLKHLWGDTYCGDDLVDDTPTQRSPNRGCPSGKNFTCGTTANGDMYMNFMDLTNDACMHLFTHGQRERMRTLFLPGGPRNTFVTSSGTKLLPSPAAASLLNDGPANTMALYPNPANTFIRLQCEPGTKLVIYNHLGQAVKTVITNTDLTTINISELSGGMYYIKTDNKNTQTAKFLKIN